MIDDIILKVFFLRNIILKVENNNAL